MPFTGTIKAYSDQVNAGVINGPDGKTYAFAKTDWNGALLPRVDQIVTFESVSARQAVKVDE